MAEKQRSFFVELVEFIVCFLQLTILVHLAINSILLSIVYYILMGLAASMAIKVNYNNIARMIPDDLLKDMVTKAGSEEKHKSLMALHFACIWPILPLTVILLRLGIIVPRRKNNRE